MIFEGLKDPFYAVDSRDYQVTEPNHNKLHEMGASILAIEKKDHTFRLKEPSCQ